MGEDKGPGGFEIKLASVAGGFLFPGTLFPILGGFLPRQKGWIDGQGLAYSFSPMRSFFAVVKNLPEQIFMEDFFSPFHGGPFTGVTGSRLNFNPCMLLASVEGEVPTPELNKQVV